jgi:hypothetical protein
MTQEQFDHLLYLENRYDRAWETRRKLLQLGKLYGSRDVVFANRNCIQILNAIKEITSTCDHYFPSGHPAGRSCLDSKLNQCRFCDSLYWPHELEPLK